MPIGKKKTTLIDANRKNENSFNRCQLEKLNDQKIWISKRHYWLYSKNSKLNIFDFAHFEKNVSNTILPLTLFFFDTHPCKTKKTFSFLMQSKQIGHS